MAAGHRGTIAGETPRHSLPPVATDGVDRRRSGRLPPGARVSFLVRPALRGFPAGLMRAPGFTTMALKAASASPALRRVMQRLLPPRRPLDYDAAKWDAEYSGG